jgi:hypothetical protein
MLQIVSTGSFDRTDKWLARLGRGDMFRAVNALAQQGVAALSSVTPVETGQTAASWSVEVQISGGGCTIWWKNTHVDAAGTPIAIMLQLGHGTGTGGYVQGKDYINPAISPIFDQIADAVWKEVQS